ncbi:MAG TPA: methyl-accepting chemotaxis protein [Gallionella sp.]|nr:methyl-accepting chemotaxis protein [Gallionella sp.]
MNIRNMKVGARLGAGFGLILVLVLAMAAVVVWKLMAVSHDAEKIESDLAMMERVIEVNDLVKTNAVESLELVVEGDADRRAKISGQIEGRKKTIGGLVADLNKDLADSPQDVELLAKMKERRGPYVASLDTVMMLMAEGKREDASMIVSEEVVPTMKPFLASIQKLDEYQNEKVDASVAMIKDASDTVRKIALAVGAVVVLLGIVIAVFITRTITGPLKEALDVANRMAEGDLTAQVSVTGRDETGQLLAAVQSVSARFSQVIGEVRGSADTLAQSSQQVNATAQSISQSTNEQAASVEETSASVEQMGASISQNSDNAKVTEGMAAQAAKQAAQGGVAVKETVGAMKQIAGKIGIVDDIAYQTNLLALNAAIEAARAGEQGKGFAVVAAEVRKLAERSQVAAQEIGELASGSVSKAEDAGKLLEQMVPAISRTSELVQEIAAASEEQSAGASQINTAMNQLNQITQQNASATEELAATAEEMSSQAERLQQLMGFFRVARA